MVYYTELEIKYNDQVIRVYSKIILYMKKHIEIIQKSLWSKSAK